MPPCSERLATLLIGGLASLQPNRSTSLDVCVLNAEDQEQAVALAVLCATSAVTSYTRISLSMGRGSVKLKAKNDEMHLGLVRHAFQTQSNRTSLPHIRALRQDAPTTRGLDTAQCSVLVIRMDGTTANARQALRVDLSHALRLAVAGAPVVAFADSPCSGKNARPPERYQGPFARFWEQCWVPQWADLVGSRSLLPLGSSPGASHGGVNTSWCSEDGGGAAADATDAGIGCIAWLSAGSLCRRRPPLLRAESATRTLVRFTDPTAALLLSKALRYFSVVRIGSADDLSDGTQRIALLFKNEVQETWVGGLASADGVTFDGATRLVYPKHARGWPKDAQGVLTHNFAMAPRADGRGYTIVGGTHRNRALSGSPNKVNGYHQGIWMAVRRPAPLANHPPLPPLPKQSSLSRDVCILLVERSLESRAASLAASPAAQTGATWEYDPLSNLSISEVDHNGARVPPETQWRGKRVALRGSHPGCIERRDRKRLVWLMPDTCEFDGRLSLVPFNGSLLLYARANMASHGQRFAQVTRSHDDGQTWARFEPIEIAGYAHSEGDVYFWAAQPNPVHARSLLATFPLVHHLAGCVGLSLSLDGVRWSRVTPLLACDAVGERALAHPASPAMVREGDTIHVYVHESVPGASVDAWTPKELYTDWRNRERPGRLARYSLPTSALERWTRRALRSLGVVAGRHV